MIDLNGKVALVTGASRGIGRAIAIRLAELGAKVVVNYFQSAERANEVVEEIKRKGGDAVAVQGDVSKFDQAQAVVKAATDTFGRLDILVNNAGTTRDNLLALMKEQDFDFIIENDLKSVFNCSKAALRQMMKQKYGRVVNITSVSGVVGNAGQTNYSAAKAGVIGFTKAMAKEYAPRGIAVNAVAAGYIPTDLTNALPADIKDNIVKFIPMGRFGTTEEIADVVAFFASDRASYITGQTLCVDGGHGLGAMDEATGAVVISPQVITTVVRQVVESTPGVARLSTSLSGRMTRVLRGNRSASGVDVEVEDNAVTIDVYIIAMPNTQLLPLGQTLQHEIHRAISDVVGMPVRLVNIHFADVQDPLGSVTSSP